MSEFVEVKTAELIGESLNWAVAKALGLTPYLAEPHYGALHRVMVRFTPYGCHFEQEKRFVPSTDWSQGGPLIDKHRLDIEHEHGKSARCVAYKIIDPRLSTKGYFGENPLIAACRAIVASVLGDTVSVPKELLS